jgi:hypothetical protein
MIQISNRNQIQLKILIPIITCPLPGKTKTCCEEALKLGIDRGAAAACGRKGKGELDLQANLKLLVLSELCIGGIRGVFPWEGF